MKTIFFEKILTKYFASDLNKFSNKHEGESCYIFGDGPSIKWFDLSAFSNLPAFSCGKMPFHNDFNKLDVRYVLLVEPWFFAPKIFQPKQVQEFEEIKDEYLDFVRRTPDKQFFIHLTNRLSLTGANINHLFRGFPKQRNHMDELLNEFDLFGGSFHAPLALAYYFGFKKVYLVGFDFWTIQPASTIRWYELGEGEYLKATNLATEFLEILKNKMEIHTISVAGSSKNVTNISYQEYTGNTPIYKENNQLTTERYLKILDTFPEYQIFKKT